MSEPIEKRLAHTCFPQPSSATSTVWRYMTLAGLVSVLETGALNLARLDLLNDPHEGSFPRTLVNARNLSLEREGFPQQMLSHIIAMGQQVRKACYVSCWAMNEYESEALWRLYGGGREGVAIKSKYQALVDSISNDDRLYVGCVRYIDYETEWFPDGNVYYPVMHKRRAFAHEHEVRIVKMSPGLQGPEVTDPALFKVPIDRNSLIEEIYVNPYSQEWYAEAVKSVVGKFAPTLAARVKWSAMKGTPLY